MLTKIITSLFSRRGENLLVLKPGTSTHLAWFRKLAYWLIFIASTAGVFLPAQAAHVATRQFMSSERAAYNACLGFAFSYGYGVTNCSYRWGSTNNMLSWEAGWLKGGGPSEVITETTNFFLGTFDFCNVGYEYKGSPEAGCTQVVDQIPSSTPRDNGPTPCQVCVPRPINPGTGNMWHTERDDAIAGPGGLAIVRTYNSNRFIPSPIPSYGFGRTWSHAYDAVLQRQEPIVLNTQTYKCRRWVETNAVDCSMPPATTGAPRAMSIIRGDGKQKIFNQQGNGDWLSHSDVSDRLVAQYNADRTVILGWTFEDVATRNTERFDATGRLLSISSKESVQTLTYRDGSATDMNAERYPADSPICVGVPDGAAVPAGRLMCVSDSYGRQLRFEYDVEGRIAKIFDPAGGEYLYAYDGISAGCQPGTSIGMACTSDNLTSVTFPDGKIKTYHYNEASRINGGVACNGMPVVGDGYGGLQNSMTGYTDENGIRHMNWTYDCNGKATSSEFANGLDRVQLSYSARDVNGDSTTSITRYIGSAANPTPQLRNYVYKNILGVRKQAGVDSPCLDCGTFALRTYDASGNDKSRSDWRGVITNFVYDLARNLQTSRVEAVGTPQARTITTEWHPVWREPAIVAEPLRKTKYTYDDAGNVLTKTVQATSDANGSLGLTAPVVGTARQWVYTYNSMNQIRTVTAPRTDLIDVTTYTYDASGNLSTVKNALGHVTTLSLYDLNGRPGRITAPNGVITNMTYSPRGWLETSTVTAGGITHLTTFGYNYSGQLTSVLMPGGATLAYVYNDAHWLKSITDNLGNSIVYTLDNVGNRVSELVQDPEGALARKTTRVFDAANRLEKVTGAQQ